MKSPGLFAVGLSLAAFLAAQEPTSTAPPPATSTGESALIKAARDAKAKRKKRTTKVITNADVKKSKGKLIQLDSTAKEPAGAPKPPETAGTQEKYDLRNRQRVAAKERADAAQKKVDGLQKELDGFEQRYYEENDPNYRDQVIQQRFTQTSKQLESARQELADARGALERLENPPQK